MADDAAPPEVASDGPEDIFSTVTSLKEAGNEALKSKDLPLASERYEEALEVWEKAFAEVPQAKALNQNDLVRFCEEGFGVIETADPIFKDYQVTSLCNGDFVKHKAGKYEEVITKFKRKELMVVPQEFFDLRLGLLQNQTLVALKLARASRAQSDWEEVVARANMALYMSGRAAKALMRKGEALLHLKDVEGAARALSMAAQETKGKDEEVNRLLQIILDAKGKGKGKKGKGKGRGGMDQQLRDDDSVHSPSDNSGGEDDYRPPRTPSRSSSSGSEKEAARGSDDCQLPSDDLDLDDQNLDQASGKTVEALRQTWASPPSFAEEARSGPGSGRSTGGRGSRCTRRRLAATIGGIAIVVLGNAFLLMRPPAGSAAAEL